jgi:hypothetical protein
MMPRIYVDEQVMAELKTRAGERIPNDVIRQLLGLWVEKPQAAEPGVYLIPHSHREFEDSGALSQFLSNDLTKDGKYLVASPHYWRNIVPGSTCMFHKDKLIIGEAKMVVGLMPYHGSETSPQTMRVYAGVVHFDPASIKVYATPVSFSEAEKLLGKTLTWRAVQRLTWEDYSRIRKASVS